jgi:Flp pilus assembly protein protease CpaA
MIDIVLISIALIILLIGSFTDFKTREVPDWVNFSGIIAGLGIRSIYSAATMDSSAGFGVFLAVALGMFYMGQWGGGDSKMLMGMGALIGLEMRPDSLLVAFFINMLIIGAAYGIVWSVFLAVRHRKKFVPYLSNHLKKPTHKRNKNILLAIAIILTIVSVAVDPYIGIALIIFAFAMLFMFYVSILLMAVEKTSMIKYVPVERLTEGDWIVKDVIVDKTSICGPKDLGISKKQIRALLKLKSQGKIEKVLIKEGMPFIPSFLIAFVFSLVAGNVVFLVF